MPSLPEKTADLLAANTYQSLRTFSDRDGSSVTVMALSEKFQIICRGEQYLDLELIEALIQHHRINRYRQSLIQQGI